MVGLIALMAVAASVAGQIVRERDKQLDEQQLLTDLCTKIGLLDETERDALTHYPEIVRLLMEPGATPTSVAERLGIAPVVIKRIRRKMEQRWLQDLSEQGTALQTQPQAAPAPASPFVSRPVPSPISLRAQLLADLIIEDLRKKLDVDFDEDFTRHELIEKLVQLGEKELEALQKRHDVLSYAIQSRYFRDPFDTTNLVKGSLRKPLARALSSLGHDWIMSIGSTRQDDAFRRERIASGETPRRVSGRHRSLADTITRRITGNVIGVTKREPIEEHISTRLAYMGQAGFSFASRQYDVLAKLLSGSSREEVCREKRIDRRSLDRLMERMDLEGLEGIVREQIEQYNERWRAELQRIDALAGRISDSLVTMKTKTRDIVIDEDDLQREINEKLGHLRRAEIAALEQDPGIVWELRNYTQINRRSNVVQNTGVDAIILREILAVFDMGWLDNIGRRDADYAKKNRLKNQRRSERGRPGPTSLRSQRSFVSDDVIERNWGHLLPLRGRIGVRLARKMTTLGKTFYGSGVLISNPAAGRRSGSEGIGILERDPATNEWIETSGTMDDVSIDASRSRDRRLFAIQPLIPDFDDRSRTKADLGKASGTDKFDVRFQRNPALFFLIGFDDQAVIEGSKGRIDLPLLRDFRGTLGLPPPGDSIYSDLYRSLIPNIETGPMFSDAEVARAIFDAVEYVLGSGGSEEMLFSGVTLNTMISNGGIYSHLAGLRDMSIRAERQWE